MELNWVKYRLDRLLFIHLRLFTTHVDHNTNRCRILIWNCYRMIWWHQYLAAKPPIHLKTIDVSIWQYGNIVFVITFPKENSPKNQYNSLVHEMNDEWAGLCILANNGRCWTAVEIASVRDNRTRPHCALLQRQTSKWLCHLQQR